MAIKVGILSAAHVHTPAYAWAMGSNPKAELIGVWDDNHGRLQEFAEAWKTQPFENLTEILRQVDAVVITSENTKHAELVEAAASQGKHILCEKPLAASEDHGQRILKAVEAAGVKLMVAFPCRYSPAFLKLVQRVRGGEIGAIKAVCATNHGRCPFGWFVDKELSGGGAMIDHVVHVADLLRVLLDDEVKSVQAQTGNNMYGQDWEDIAMLTLEFTGGVFATLDSSWSRPAKSFKTWGDVTMNVVGDKGVIELDMFNQHVDVYTEESGKHSMDGYGTNLDAAMVDDFLTCIEQDRPPAVSGFDGMQAAGVAIAGYRSVGRPSPVLL